MKDGKKCVATCGNSLFGLLLLVLGVLWLLSANGTITMNIPWVPTLVIIIAIGIMVKHCRCK